MYYVSKLYQKYRPARIYLQICRNPCYFCIMSDPLSQLQQTLHTASQSLTSQRQNNFNALLGHQPQTMHELTKRCGPDIDRATVYRTITLFEKLGIAQRIQSGWKYRIELSDSFQPHHHHMYCVDCTKTVVLPEDEQLEQQLRSLAAAQSFLPTEHQIEVRGVCAPCQINRASCRG